MYSVCTGENISYSFSWHYFAFVLAITIFIETIVLLLLLSKKCDFKKIVLTGVISSTVTLPFVWYFFPVFVTNFILFCLVSELFAVLAEAVIYHKILNVYLKEAVVYSFIANTISFVFGFVVLNG